MFLRLCATIVAVACSAFAYTRCAVCLCLAAMLGACGGGVPDCDDSATVKTALEIINDNAGWAEGKEPTVTLENILTESHDATIDKYTCKGQLTVTGPDGDSLTAPIAFTAQALADGDAGEFWVEIENMQTWIARAVEMRMGG